MNCACGEKGCGWSLNVLDGNLEVCDRTGENFTNIFIHLDPNLAVELITALHGYLEGASGLRTRSGPAVNVEPSPPGGGAVDSPHVGVAQSAERDVANVEAAGSSPAVHSKVGRIPPAYILGKPRQGNPSECQVGGCRRAFYHGGKHSLDPTPRADWPVGQWFDRSAWRGSA